MIDSVWSISLHYYYVHISHLNYKVFHQRKFLLYDTFLFHYVPTSEIRMIWHFSSNMPFTDVNSFFWSSSPAFISFLIPSASRSYSAFISTCPAFISCNWAVKTSRSCFIRSSMALAIINQLLKPDSETRIISNMGISCDLTVHENIFLKKT